ncbi:MAG: alpha/beta hydrolase family protein, partial [Afipia sp.]
MALRDAPITQGQFPLILVSHGGLRSAEDSGAWLSSALARSGRIVVEVNGPRPGTGAEAVNEIWRRAHQLSRALDAILSDPEWADHIDPDDVSVVGFALGGTAALEVAGAEISVPAAARRSGCDGRDNRDESDAPGADRGEGVARTKVCPGGALRRPSG